jgi:hypothetical protein
MSEALSTYYYTIEYNSLWYYVAVQGKRWENIKAEPSHAACQVQAQKNSGSNKVLKKSEWYEV